MIYFNFIRCVVYKFTASLPQIRYKVRITFKSVNSLYYSVKSPVPVKEELLFKSGIKVAAPPPPPIININNSHLSTQPLTQIFFAGWCFRIIYLISHLIALKGNKHPSLKELGQSLSALIIFTLS